MKDLLLVLLAAAVAVGLMAAVFVTVVATHPWLALGGIAVQLVTDGHSAPGGGVAPVTVPAVPVPVGGGAPAIVEAIEREAMTWLGTPSLPRRRASACRG